jgi:putative IMPACT (imprinted ancient) family translation regulator
MIIKYFDEFEGKFYDISGDTGSALKYGVDGWSSIDGGKKYVALLSQSGTSAPTAIVLEDDFGDITISYDSIGQYFIQSSGNQFTEDKTWMIIHTNYTDGSNVYQFNLNWDSDEKIVLNTYKEITKLDGLLINTSIEIRTYK